MNKRQLVSTIAKEVGITQGKADEFLNVTLQEIIKATIEEREVTLSGFGKFTLKEVPERIGTNPQTGEKITIASHDRIVFKPFGVFKESLKA